MTWACLGFTGCEPTALGASRAPRIMGKSSGGCWLSSFLTSSRLQRTGGLHCPPRASTMTTFTSHSAQSFSPWDPVGNPHSEGTWRQPMAQMCFGDTAQSSPHIWLFLPPMVWCVASGSVVCGRRQHGRVAWAAGFRWLLPQAWHSRGTDTSSAQCVHFVQTTSLPIGVTDDVK
jgi:hypothetical protein